MAASEFLGQFGIAGSVATALIAVALILFAFFSYKLLKLGLVIVGAVGGATLGSGTVLKIVEGLITEPIPYLNIIVMVVCGALGAILMLSLKNLAIFAAGAFLGYTIGTAINSAVAAHLALEFLTSLPGSLIVPVVCAIIAGIICRFVFKFVYIIGTAGGASLAGVSMLISAFVPAISSFSLWIGLAIAVIAIVFQLKTTKEGK